MIPDWFTAFNWAGPRPGFVRRKGLRTVSEVVVLAEYYQSVILGRIVIVRDISYQYEVSGVGWNWSLDYCGRRRHKYLFFHHRRQIQVNARVAGIQFEVWIFHRVIHTAAVL